MLRDIPLHAIDPDPQQPRRHFDEDKLAELAQSMDENGLIVPILVRPAGERFIIVHGERRYRAAQSLKWATITANVRDIPTEEARLLALVENVQRADLTPLEEARSFQAWLDTGLTQSELGQRIGKSQSYIATKLRLLRLPAPLAHLLDQDILTQGHLKQLLRLRAFYRGATHDWGPQPKEVPDAVEEMLPFSFMLAGRPEDSPPVNIGRLYTGLQENTIAHQSILMLFETVEKNDWVIDAWESTAVWFGVIAALTPLSVADLKTSLDLWIERIEAAAFWLSTQGHSPAEGNGARAQLHQLHQYGHRSDLRHAGLSHWAQDPPRDIILDWVGRDHIIAPSDCQPWGPNAHTYVTLTQTSEVEIHD